MTVTDHIGSAASVLLDARRQRRWLSAFSDGCRPTTLGQAYAIQAAVLSEIGPVAAWKVGAGSSDATPACAAIAPATLFQTGATLRADMFHLLGIEAEIAYSFAGDLPPRATPYSLDEVCGAIAAVHPAIEVSDTRFVAWASQDRLSHVADQLNHGALIVGPGRSDWRDVVPTAQKTLLAINGSRAAEATGGNPAGDPFRLLHWLVNEGSRPHGGVKAGSIVTTGSVTGVKFEHAPVDARADLPGIGSVDVAIR